MLCRRDLFGLFNSLFFISVVALGRRICCHVRFVVVQSVVVGKLVVSDAVEFVNRNPFFDNYSLEVGKGPVNKRFERCVGRETYLFVFADDCAFARVYIHAFTLTHGDGLECAEAANFDKLVAAETLLNYGKEAAAEGVGSIGGQLGLLCEDGSQIGESGFLVQRSGG